MKIKILLAVLDGRVVGRVVMDRHGRLSFTYEESWRSFDGAFPLSLSMPLAAATHPHAAIETFLAGLLPDSETVLESWAQRFQASRHPFALLCHVGEDCPGAFQFIREERLSGVESAKAMRVKWLTEGDIAERLRALRADRSAWRAPGDAGQFSLGGAQAKTALLFHNGRWGVPSGRTPTTHILKPAISGFDGHVENEHLCMELARSLGMPVASSEVKSFGGETVIVVERFDRVMTAARSPILRLHQEDMCQALCVPPSRKYQAEGGPGPGEIVKLLRTHSRRAGDDVWTFIDALGFSWLIGGTDAHAKNYSVLHGGGGRVRLAPLYDMASILPYDGFKPASLKLSMRIGGTYRLREIDARAWRKAAEELALDPDEIVERMLRMARALPERFADIVAEARALGLNHPIIGRLESVLSERARHVARVLARR